MTAPELAIHATAARRDRFAYVLVAAVVVAVVFAGFSRTYYLGPVFRAPALSPLVHVHAIVFTSWLALFVAQVALVAARRTRVHRRLGYAGVVVAPLMIGVGAATAIQAAKRGNAEGAAGALPFLATPLVDLLVFAILVGTALLLRRRVELHKRLMVVAAIGLLPAAVARLPLGFIERGGALEVFGLVDLLLLAFVARDTAVHRRLHPAYLWGGALLVASGPLRVALSTTAPWLDFARWLTR